MVYAQQRTRPLKWDTQNSLRFWDTNRSPNLGQTTRMSYGQQKKRTCRIVNFTILADHTVKIKESEKRNKYQDLAREPKRKLWNMKVSMISIAIFTFRTIPKVETIQTTALSRSARILRRAQETRGDSIVRPSTNADVKNHQRNKIKIT